jgi:3-oxosteroid 1-dehydrogenase
MTGALRAADLGGESLIVEKASVYGGSTALSGGVVWVPDNPGMARHGIDDSPEEGLAYLEAVTRGSSTTERLRAYIDTAPRMMTTLAEKSPVHFESLRTYPDYYPETEGGKRGGRSCEPVGFNALRLGEEFTRMRFIPVQKRIAGGRVMFGVEEGHRLLTGGVIAAWFLVRELFSYYTNLKARRRGYVNTNLRLGPALVGSLRLSLMDRRVPLWLDTTVKELVSENGRVVGAVIEREGGLVRIKARKGVLLAAGGFERNAELRQKYQQGPIGNRWTVGCESNTGAALDLGVAVGASLGLMDDAWWCPCTLAPFPATSPSWIMVFEKNLPGSIIVNKRGKRFMNEAAPYNDVVKSMYTANTPEAPTIPAAFIFDATYRRKYPCGPMLPGYAAPDRLVSNELKESYFEKDGTLEGLARKINVDVEGLLDTVRRFNRFAATGEDLEFGRGKSLQDRYYTRETKFSNPTLGPIEKPPFYAVQVFPGDLGTKGGFRTDARARVLTEGGEPIPGLYAAGNCSAAVMGATYPGAGATIGPAMTFAFISAEHALGVRIDAGRGGHERGNAPADGI